MVHKFEKLKLWNESVVLIKLIYKFCEKLPKQEERNLGDQLRRAVTSVSLNIAEGSASETDAEFKRFLFISKKSQIEVIAILKIVNYLYNIPVVVEITKAEEIGKMLQGLVKYLRK